MDDRKNGDIKTSQTPLVANSLQAIADGTEKENSKDFMNAENVALRTDDSSTTQEIDTQLDILQFQNKFYECIEELKIRRVTDAENEEKINQLVSTQHDHQRAIKEEISKNSILSEKHSQELSELKRQHEEKIHQLQAEKNKLALAAETCEKEITEIKDDIRTLQLTKHSLEKTIKDQEQQLQMQGSTRSSHLSKMTELEALGKDVSKQCSAVAEQLKRLESNVREAQKLQGKLSFINQHQTCTKDSLKADLERKTEEIISLRAELDEKPNRQDNNLKSVQGKHKQTEKLLKQKENACKQLSEQLEEARSANQNLLESLARSQQLSERHLATSNQSAEHASSLAKEVKKLEGELGQLKDDLCRKGKELQSETQRNEDLTAKFQNQEESLRRQLASQQEENKSLVEARDNLEELNINWSKKNSEMVDVIRELQEKISEFETEEKHKDTKSTNTDPEHWLPKDVMRQRPSPGGTEKASYEIAAVKEREDGKPDDRELQEKAGNDVSKTSQDTSCDQVNMQIGTATSEQVPSSAQCESLQLAVAVKDEGTPSPIHTDGERPSSEKARLVQDNSDTQKEAKSSSSDSKITTDKASETVLESSAEGKTELGETQKDRCGEIEMKTEYPRSPIEKNETDRPSEIIEAPEKSSTVMTSLEITEANGEFQTSTNKAFKSVSIVDSTKMATNLADLEVNQVPPKTALQILSPESSHNQKLIDQSIPDELQNVSHYQPVKKDIANQGLEGKILTKSEDANEIAEQTEDQSSLQTRLGINQTQVVQGIPQGSSASYLERVSIPNPLSSKRTSHCDQSSTLQIQSSTSYLNQTVSSRTRSSSVLPGFSLLASHPRYGVTPQAKPSSSEPPRPTVPRKTVNVTESTNLSLNEIPPLGKYQDGNNAGKYSSSKEREGSQEWPNFAEEFESASGSSAAPLHIDYTASLGAKSTPRRASAPAEVFPSVGSKRPSSSCHDDQDHEPMLFSDDDDDQSDIKTEVASQIHRIQSFLRSDRLKRPRRSATNKGPVV